MKVTLGTLKGKGDELAAFLEPRVGVKPSVSGDSIVIEDEGVREGVRPRQVKTYIKRFLFMNGVRKKYRIFVSGKELTIQEIVLGEEPEEEKEEKKAPAKEPEEAEGETAKSPEASEPEEEGPKAGEPEEGEEPEEKPKKAAPKKPRSKKKKAE